MLNDLDITPNDPEELRAVNRLLADEVKALSLKVEQLQHQLHADGYSGFNSVFGDDKADEMACMAHVRRKFVDVFASQGNAIS